MPDDQRAYHGGGGGGGNRPSFRERKGTLKMYGLGRWKSCHKDFFIRTSAWFLLNPFYFPLQRVELHATELEKQHSVTLDVRQNPLVTTQERKIRHSQRYLRATIKCGGMGTG